MRVLALFLLFVFGCSRSESRVVLYCAQDREFAESILESFEKQQQLEIAEKFDTEANKSVGLYQEIVSEANRPRCDLFWNNEILSTIRLQKQGLLAVYRSPSAEHFPNWTKASDGTWQAFAARARVLIVNTDRVPLHDQPQRIVDLIDPKWKQQLVMAKPQFGTTATQAASLFEVLGEDQAKAFYRGLKANEIALVAGNKQVAEQVGSGRYAIGLTDQDDAILEIQAGRPVRILYPDRQADPMNPRMGTLLIPNTLALIQGSPNPTGAKKLIDYLLSVEIEKQLAEGGGYQIPLNRNVNYTPHPALQDVNAIKAMEVDWEKAADLWNRVQAFLRDEFAR